MADPSKAAPKAEKIRAGAWRHNHIDCYLELLRSKARGSPIKTPRAMEDAFLDAVVRGSSGFAMRSF
jgi:hypothetical protein